MTKFQPVMFEAYVRALEKVAASTRSQAPADNQAHAHSQQIPQIPWVSLRRVLHQSNFASFRRFDFLCFTVPPVQPFQGKPPFRSVTIVYAKDSMSSRRERPSQFTGKNAQRGDSRS
jgi:hypothetical protein